MRNLGWQTGRGFAPPKGGYRGWWLIWGWFRVEWHPRWWRVGLSATPRTLGVYLGPLVIAFGKPTWRWHIWPATTSAWAGADTWQDQAFTITVTTGVSKGDAA